MNGAVMALYPELILHFCLPDLYALDLYCISWPRWLHTPWSQSRVHSVHRKTPPTQLGRVKEGSGFFKDKKKKKKHDITPPWKRCIKFNAMKRNFGEGSFPWKKAWGVYSVSYVLAHSCLLQSLGNILKAFHGDILWCVPQREKRPQRAVEFIDWISQL